MSPMGLLGHVSARGSPAQARSPQATEASSARPPSPHHGGKHGGFQVCPSDPFQKRGGGGTIRGALSPLPLFCPRSAFTTQPSSVGHSGRGTHRSTAPDSASGTTFQSPSHPEDPGLSKLPSGRVFRCPGRHATSFCGGAPAGCSYSAAILATPTVL
ncbi:hypothetical protein NDU88_005149 [Pleurodeles waltl]|uniref:Uncharacterized protein n=1 Tax=Pleurodeles waltl TaxID=8319 RepID=A0AAV7RMG3_PLEWA|nr:hypothetical protein NDU88_005149 [Pleurodeles waltl]